MKLLPCRPPPFEGELLSSWVKRLALANHCSFFEFCRYLGFEQREVPETVAEFGQVNLKHLCFVVQREPDGLTAMLLPEGNLLCVRYVAEGNFQYCPRCTAQTPDLVLRHWRFVWSTDCGRCGQELVPMQSGEPEAGIVSVKLAARAKRGAEVLKSIFEAGNFQSARHLSRVFHMMCAKGLTDSTSLMSDKKTVRSEALAAIGTCLSSTMLASRRDNRKKVSATRHLSRLFPEYRDAITKIMAATEVCVQDPPKQSVGEVLRQPQTRELPDTTPATSALVAAKQAIEELGSDADRQKLLARADAIWAVKKKLTGTQYT